MARRLSPRVLPHRIVVSGLVTENGRQSFEVKENTDPLSRQCVIQSTSEEEVDLTGAAKGQLFVIYINPVSDIAVGDKIVDQDEKTYKVAGVEQIIYGIKHTKISMTAED